MAGVLCGFLIVGAEQGRFGNPPRNRLALELTVMGVIGVASFVLALAVA